MEYFTQVLTDNEYQQLQKKGYLKVKFSIPLVDLDKFNTSYKNGKEVSFSYKDRTVLTNVTSIDISDGHEDQTCTVFMGLAHQ